MVLADALRELLAAGKAMISDPAVKQAIADDLALLEEKASQGIDVLEQHIAGWFAAHYSLPAPAAAGAPGTPEPAGAAAAAEVPGQQF